MAIDDDVLVAAKEIAAAERKSVGEVISSLALSAIRLDSFKRITGNRVTLPFARPGASLVTSEQVYLLQEELL
jgi:hypothetical protein